MSASNLMYLFEKLYPEHTFRWQRRGNSAKGCCPFHDDRNPSMQIYEHAGKTRWYCFAEQIGGREIDAVARALNITLDRANTWLISNGFLQETEVDRNIRLRNSLFTDFYKWTNEMLCTAPEAAPLRAYLKTRGIEDALLPIAAIGYYPTTQAVETWLKEKDADPASYADFIPKADRSKDMAAGSVIFFYKESYDLWYRLKLRNPLRETDGEKITLYLGAKNATFKGFFPAVNELKSSDFGIVVEGEFDALALMSLCLRTHPDSREYIFSLGSGGNLASGIDLLLNCGIEDIYTFPDNDEAGLEYTSAVAETYPHTFILFPEDYKDKDDPADWAKGHEFEDLDKVFRGNRYPAYEWLGRQMAEEFSKGTGEDQSHLKLKLIELARKLSPTNRELFLKAYSPLSGVSYEALWEEVQTCGDVRYRKVLDDPAFGIHMVNERSKAKDFERISNVILEFVRDVIWDVGSEDGDIERMLVVRAAMFTKEKLLRLKASDFNDDKTLTNILVKELGSDVWVKPRFIPFLREAATLLPMAHTKVEQTVYGHVGWRDGKFLMPNGYVDHDGFHTHESFTVELPRNPKMFTKYELAEAPADCADILRIVREDLLQIYGPEVTYPMFAHMFLAPLISLIPDMRPYALWVRGLTGTYKTTLTCLMASFFGDFTKGDATETFRSTGNALEKNGFYVKDCPYIVDDYKQVDVKDQYIVSLFQNYGDGHSRSRLKADTSQQQSWPIRGLLCCTGEDLDLQGLTSVTA